ncbi:MAG: hypothetical protein KF832_19740 [Caldilineaceae bacterium]|nr:hypothetical protein [Caldilineaceae bacterium]
MRDRAGGKYPYGWRWIWLFGLLIVGWPTIVNAHGSGAPRLADVPAGPYRLWVWSLPDPVRVGEMHLSVAVAEAIPEQTSDPDVAVTIRLVAQAAPQVELRQAASKQARFLQTYYETDFMIPTVGEWQASVTIEGAAGKGSADFPITVLPPQALSWTMALWGGLALVAIVGGIWARRGS